MSIPTSGSAALLVVATLALSACGGGSSSVTTTTTVSPGAAETTATQTVAAETTPAQTTKTQTQQQTQTTAPSKPAPATTQKTRTTAPKPAAPAKPASGCADVDVGARDGDVDETYARITSISKTPCPLATFVIQQWGGQKIGAGKALLPLGWDCTGNTCSKGSSRVSFTLRFPSE